MEHLAAKIPDRVNAYIKKHYPGYRLICCKEDKDGKGQLFYIIDFIYSDKYHHLKVTDTGILIHEDIEPQFLNHYHEQYF